jgi:hypothetical protein
MANLFRHMTRTAHGLALSALALTLLANAPCALAQSAAPASSQGAARAGNPGDGKTAAQTPDARINAAEVGKRVDQELGIDLPATGSDNWICWRKNSAVRVCAIRSSMSFVIASSACVRKPLIFGISCSRGCKPTKHR